MPKQTKVKCPNCGSEDTKPYSLPMSRDDEEFIYCNNCKKVTIVLKVKIDESKD